MTIMKTTEILSKGYLSVSNPKTKTVDQRPDFN